MAQGLKATILAKIEGRNPAYSVKCRIGANMIWKAEREGWLKPGMEIIEPTSGNTGIALAFVAAARGYKLHVTMPETMSIERRKVLTLFGAHIILTPGEKGMRGAVEEAERIVQSDPLRYYCPSNSRIQPIPKSILRRQAQRFGSKLMARSICLSQGLEQEGRLQEFRDTSSGRKRRRL